MVSSEAYISYHVNQEPHMVSLEAYKSIKCTAEAIMYIRSITWVYFISHQVYCRGRHLTSGTTLGCTSLASLGCTVFVIKRSAYPIM